MPRDGLRAAARDARTSDAAADAGAAAGAVPLLRHRDMCGAEHRTQHPREVRSRMRGPAGARPAPPPLRRLLSDTSAWAGPGAVAVVMHVRRLRWVPEVVLGEGRVQLQLRQRRSELQMWIRHGVQQLAA